MECMIPDFYSTMEPKARKQHKCCECSAPIVKGEKYLRCAGKWEGVISCYKQHLLCADACMFIRDRFQDGECIGFGTLSEHWNEYAKEYDKKRPDVQEFRVILAKILKRERND